MRRDTATPAFGGLAFSDPFRHVAFAGLCLSFLWLILFDLVRFLIGLAFCVLEFREFVELGLHGVANISKLVSTSMSDRF